MIGARGRLTCSGRPRAAGTGTGVALAAVVALTLGLLVPTTAAATENVDPSPTAESTAAQTRAERSEQERVSTAEDSELPPAPVPAVPANLPAAVDPLALYEGQADCRPPEVTALNEGTVALAQLIRDTYGSVARAVGGIHRPCSWGGSDPVYGSRSEHKEGRAVDWMIDMQDANALSAAEAFLDWLYATDEQGNKFAMARRLGVMYVGWNNKIWESYTQKESELHGCFSRPERIHDTDCHRDHIHISLSWDGAAGLTSFWGGSPTPAPFCSRWATASSEPKPADRGLDFIPVTPRRVLDTRSGLGLPNETPCRLWQRSGGIRLNGVMDPRHSIGAPVALKVEDLRGVPRGDIRAVAVRTTTIGSNSPATLRAATFAGEPIAPVKIGGRTETTTVIPVGTDGTIAFTTDSGATHLLVDVLGYFVAPASVTAVGTGLTLSDSSVVYDTADDTVLGPRERRVIRIDVDGGVPTGAILAVTASGGERSGKLIVRPAGTKRTSATPVLSYRRADTSTQTLLTKLGDEGDIIVVNRGRGAVNVQVAVQAASLPASTSGALVVPVQPTSIDGQRTAVRRVLRDAKDSAGVVLQVDATTKSKSASITYRAGNAAPATLHIGRQSSQSSLIVVPMTDSALIMREIVGGDVEVTARIVAYLR